MVELSRRERLRGFILSALACAFAAGVGLGSGEVLGSVPFAVGAVVLAIAAFGAALDPSDSEAGRQHAASLLERWGEHQAVEVLLRHWYDPQEPAAYPERVLRAVAEWFDDPKNPAVTVDLTTIWKPERLSAGFILRRVADSLVAKTDARQSRSPLHEYPGNPAYPVEWPQERECPQCRGPLDVEPTLAGDGIEDCPHCSYPLTTAPPDSESTSSSESRGSSGGEG